MSTATAPAAQAETAATPTPEALPASPGAAAAKFVAKQDAAKQEKTRDEEKVKETQAAQPGPKDGKQKPRIDPNLVRREREATERAQRAADIEAKFRPLSEALGKKDLRGALSILAKDHGVTFADFVEVLKSSGDEDESTEQKVERIAREAIEKAKATDAEKTAKEAKDRDEAEKKASDEKLAAFRAGLQEQAEGDERWKQTALSETGGKAWDAIERFYAVTNVALAKDEALDVVEESWKVVEAHFGETKKRLPIDKAIQLVVNELAKLGAEGARAKLKEARTPSAQGQQARNEAGTAQNGGRAAEPRINNRTTSGAPGVRPERDPNAPVTFGKAAVDDAIKRAGIRLQ